MFEDLHLEDDKFEIIFFGVLVSIIIGIMCMMIGGDILLFIGLIFGLTIVGIVVLFGIAFGITVLIAYCMSKFKGISERFKERRKENG